MQNLTPRPNLSFRAWAYFYTPVFVLILLLYGILPPALRPMWTSLNVGSDLADLGTKLVFFIFSMQISFLSFRLALRCNVFPHLADAGQNNPQDPAGTSSTPTDG